MTRNHSRSPVTGRHRVARRTKIAMGAIGLAIAVGALAVAVTTGRTGEASADPADASFFIDINKVPSGVNVNQALKRQGAKGSFTVDCGTNADGAHHNPDNFIAQPGIKNGAQHLHDYVGNVTTDADSSLKSLLAGDTTCKNGDQSAYFWPVIRIDREDAAASESKNRKAQQEQQNIREENNDQSARDKQDAQQAEQQTVQQRRRDGGNQQRQNRNQQELGGPQGPNEEVGDNDGEILEPESATITFLSGGANRVVPMPLGLRILYGDAKQSTNGPANARPSWTCTGFEDRLTDHYPICPQGSKVERIHAFPNCWDGQNTDSANHRTHIVFADRAGRCPRGFKNVPQLQITLVYDVPHDVQVNGQYKVDAFAQEKHNPRSDHDDFANVMSKAIMNRVVGCINAGKRCAE